MSKKILAIETSCDETACAIIDDNKQILANIVFSQIDEHKAYGGVVPELASRAHIDKILPITQQALNEAKLSMHDIDAFAVTAGPGLIGGVIVGLMTIKAFATAHNKPLYCINHLEGHALTTRLTDNIELPYILLLVSGGHCQYVLAYEEMNFIKYTILGATIDDAVGEAFDKVAKMLNLGYPGGPIIEKLAQKGDAQKYNFPKPLCDNRYKQKCLNTGRENNLRDSDMSFSGLKTSIFNLLKEKEFNVTEQEIFDICASFQDTVADILIYKSAKSIDAAREIFPNIKNFVISGGVAANKYINAKLKHLVNTAGLEYSAPPLKLCTDNAAMIAYAALEKLKRNYSADSITFCPKARWNLDSL